MAEAALIAKTAGGVLSGVSSLSQAAAQRKQAGINAYIAETRALQTGTDAAEGLASELATLRTTLATNGQRGGMEFWQELRRVRGREARLAVQGERTAAADYRAQGRSAMTAGWAGALGGFTQAAQGGYNLMNLSASGLTLPRFDIWGQQSRSGHSLGGS